MLDIVLVVALIALTAVSCLYIGACDHLESSDGERSGAQAPSQSNVAR
jgi:hypothetical protein